MKFRAAMMLAMLLCPFLADAQTSRAEVRNSVENSMLVTGSIDIGANGKVTAHRLDQPEKLPKPVVDFIAKAVPALAFEPALMDGKPIEARVKMGVRVVARKLDNGDYRLGIAGASFGEQGDVPKDKRLTFADVRRPRYPEAAYLSNVTGTVYMVVKVGKQGKVEDVAVEQTNLTVLGNERQMETGRKLLEKASIAVAQSWTFDIPTTGDLADETYWSARVPVSYELRADAQDEPSYGVWQTYVPGPKHRIPWISEEENRRSPVAMIAGGLYPVGSGPKLVTPEGG